MADAYVTLVCSTPNLQIRRYVLLKQVFLKQFIENWCSERRDDVG